MTQCMNPQDKHRSDGFPFGAEVLFGNGLSLFGNRLVLVRQRDNVSHQFLTKANLLKSRGAKPPV